MIKPKISIIITAYNIEKFIEESVGSILDQDMKDVEIICVDDASTDHTFEILGDLKKKSDKITVIRNSVNKGQASSRNAGCRAARGEYLYMLDGDDYLKKGALKRLYNCAKEFDLDVLTFSGEVVFENEYMEIAHGYEQYIYTRKGSYSGVYTGVELFAKMLENNDKHGNMCFQFLKNDFYKSNNLYAKEGMRYGEDSPFAIYLAAQRAMCIPDILYCRRFRENSVVMSEKKTCHLESLLIQYVNDLCLWQGKDYTENINYNIEKYFISRLRSIKDIDKQIKVKEEMPLMKKYPVAQHIYRYLIKESSMYCELLTKDKINDLKKYKNVIVYGTGTIASYVMELLKKNGIDDYKLAVSDNRNIGNYHGDKYVFNIADLREIKEESVVLIAVGNKYKEEMRANLKVLGYQNTVDVSNY